MTGIDCVAVHGQDIVALAADGCAVIGVGEDAAHRVQIATPWFLRMLSPCAPSYHFTKGDMYLKGAFDLLRQEGARMPEGISIQLLDQYDQFVFLSLVYARLLLTLYAVFVNSRMSGKVPIPRVERISQSGDVKPRSYCAM